MVATAFVMAAAATAGNGNGGAGSTNGLKAYVQSTLLSAVQQNPKQSFDVIVESTDPKASGHGFVQKLLSDTSGSADETIGRGDVRKEFQSINGAELTLTGKQILRLARSGDAGAILPNDAVRKSDATLTTYNLQMWSWTTLAPYNWLSTTPSAPTIAIVDSGIDTSHGADFGSRLLGQVNLASLAPNAPGDGSGHGTFVAGIAADSAAGYAGAAPTANLLSVDVMDDQGEATVTDVISACDWILQNKATYNIKVANFSLHAVNRASVLFDPLDRAVEKLWLNGVVVVTAAGNYATDGQSTEVSFAPGNDPFVITVGAADTMGTMSQSDDTAAPWSVWGYTADGFRKPDVSAPGRYMVGPTNPVGYLATQFPAKVTSPGYIQMSGTSFSAPVVSGEAAMLAALHPTWTPGMIKGALMVTAVPSTSTSVSLGQLGVGEVNLYRGETYGSTPPNPNTALNQFVTTAADGTRVFDSAAWQSAAWGSAAWGSAAWSDAAWSSAAWSSAAWGSAAWSDAAWASAAWGSAAWSDAAWSDAAWSDAAWSDGALGDSVLDETTLDTATPDQSSTTADLSITDTSILP